MIKNWLYYVKRLKQLGAYNTWQTIQKRINQKKYQITWKQKAINLRANHTWQQIAKQHNLNTDFLVFLTQIKENNIWDKITKEPLFKKMLPSKLGSISPTEKQFIKGPSVDFMPEQKSKNGRPNIFHPPSLAKNCHWA